MIFEYFRIAFQNIKTRPMRSWLTIFGILIGIFLVISLISLSEGIKEAVTRELRMMGKDVIMVLPGEFTDLALMFAGGMKLSDNDIRSVKRAQGVDLVVPISWRAEMVRHNREVKTVLLYGYPQEQGQQFLQENMGWYLTYGRWPNQGRNEAIVGNIVPQDIFPNMRIGDQVVVAGRRITITGILRSLGNRQDDSMIGLDLELFGNITGEREGAQSLMVRANPDFNPEIVVKNIEQELEQIRQRQRNRDLPPVSVLSSEKIAGIVGNIMTIIQTMILVFASISIIVGGIGIMNTMYTSVHERTKEIGIMKAIGAKNSMISLIFLIESGILGLIGGIGGVISGLLLAQIIELYLQASPMFYLRAVITPQLIIFGLLFSFFVGCLAGFLPARRAIKLKPVEALKYE